MSIIDMSNKILYTNCSKLFKLLKMVATQNLSTMDLGIQQAKMIKVVVNNPGCSSSFIAKEICSDPAAITRALDSLIKKKILTKKENSEDRRQWGIHPTANGRKQLEKIENCLEQAADKIFTRLNSTDKKQLEKILIKLLKE